MLRLTVLLLTVAGCDLTWGYRDVVLVPQGGGVEWATRVTAAADAWNSVIEPECGWVTFIVEDERQASGDGYPVQLVPRERWGHPGSAGVTEYDHIEVRTGLSPSDERHVLLHELGHTLGLSHQTRYPSVMDPRPESYGVDISRYDVEAVSKLAGCWTD